MSFTNQYVINQTSLPSPLHTMSPLPTPPPDPHPSPSPPPHSKWRHAAPHGRATYYNILVNISQCAYQKLHRRRGNDDTIADETEYAGYGPTFLYNIEIKSVYLTHHMEQTTQYRVGSFRVRCWALAWTGGVHNGQCSGTVPHNPPGSLTTMEPNCTGRPPRDCRRLRIGIRAGMLLNCAWLTGEESRAPSQYKNRLSQVWGFPC